MATELSVAGHANVIHRLNTVWHRPALTAFALVVVLHWAEHVAQAFELWVLDTARPNANGLLGQAVPWLVTTEWLHFAYAALMLAGFALMLPGFVGRGRRVWALALTIQAWHLIEHALLFYQAQTHNFLADRSQPTSVLQVLFPGARPEIHLFYNAVVTIPMLIALYYHLYPPRRERTTVRAICGCALV